MTSQDAERRMLSLPSSGCSNVDMNENQREETLQHVKEQEYVAEIYFYGSTLYGILRSASFNISGLNCL